MATPPCRVCGKTEPVLCYPDEHELTICPDCCAKAEHPNGETGHDFVYDRHERDHACYNCGIFRRATDYDYSEDYGP